METKFAVALSETCGISPYFSFCFKVLHFLDFSGEERCVCVHGRVKWDMERLLKKRRERRD